MYDKGKATTIKFIVSHGRAGRFSSDFLAHLCLCTVGSYASLSVPLSVTGPKLRRLENNSHLKKHSSWYVSRSDISLDGSKSACWCHSKSINVAHDEVNWIWFPDEFYVVTVEYMQVSYYGRGMEVASLHILNCQTPFHVARCKSFLTKCLTTTCKSIRNGRWAHFNVKLHF